MPSSDLRFDVRDLAAAACDSCGDAQPLGFDLRERSAVRLQTRLPATEVLPALDDAIHVLRIQLDTVAGTPAHFRGDEGGSRAEERVVDDRATLGVIQNGLAHKLDRLLRGVVLLIIAQIFRAAHDEFRTLRRPNGSILTSLRAEP